MAIYYILLVVIILLGYLICEKNPSKTKNIIYLAIIFGFLWVMVTFRQDTGHDYTTYINIFKEIKEMDSFGGVMGTRFEIGFTLLTKFMTTFVSSSVMMYGIYGILMLAPMAYFIYKYSSNIWISSWLYVTMAFFYNNLNFIRQSLACAVCVMAYRFFVSEETFDITTPIMLTKKDDKGNKTKENFVLHIYKHAIPFLLMALLAISFHKTAAIIIPAYIFAHMRLNAATISLYGVVVLTAYTLSTQIIDYIMENTVYGYYKGTDYVLGKLGPQFLMVPITILVLVLATFYWWKNIEPNAYVLLNVVIVNATIWVFGATRHMIVERFSMYSYIYLIIVVPSALRSMLASPKAVEEYALLQEDIDRRVNVPNSVTAKANKLGQEISDNKKYYMSALVAILIITFIYNYYGMTIGKFHGVFPFKWITSSGIVWF